MQSNCVSIVSLLAVLCITSSCSNGPDVPLAFNGSSEHLKATKVVPTLDAPIPNGMNVIWCASFQAAWKALEHDLAGGPVLLDGSPQTATSLNDAPDPRPFIPETSLYVATGWVKDGITNRIQQEIKRRFPRKKAPTFRGITPDSLVTYCYLEANLVFPIPYYQSTEPLRFTNGAGGSTEVSSFGASTEDHRAYSKLLGQLRILFQKPGGQGKDPEFAIDLCTTSSPSQIVAARISPEPTLAATLARLDREVARAAELDKTSRSYEEQRQHSLTPGDRLFVPDLHWFISHSFLELQGKTLDNQKLKGQRFDIAQQDIAFFLHRKGAELKSEAKSYASSADAPRDFLFDRPFLLCMKKRNTDAPYFVMWIENAELLNPWQKSR